MLQNIPDALAERPQWLMWRFEPNARNPEGKPLKVPYYADGGRRVGDQGTDKDRARLVTLDRVLAVYKGRRMDGVGFAFLPGDGLVGIDLDKVLDKDTGEMDAQALEIVRRCCSYTEYSPSGTGVHIIGLADTHTAKSNDIGVEIYTGRQYFTVTGNLFPDVPRSVQKIAPTDLDWVHSLVAAAKEARRKPSATSAPSPGAAGPQGSPDLRAQLESALAHVSPDLGYSDWLEVGMALYAELGESGFGLFDYWSRKGAKYAGEKDTRAKWKSFSSGIKTVSRAKIFSLAKGGGFRPPPPPGAEPPQRTTQVRPAGKKPTGAGTSTPQDGAAAQPDGSAKQPAAAETEDDAPPAGKAKGKSGRKFPLEFWDRLERLVQRYTLIYTTDTAWDSEVRTLVKVSAMRLAFGKDLVNFWLASYDRRMVNPNQVVFDPSMSCDPATTVNMFGGWPLKPDATKSCAKVMELLHYLCGEDDAVFTWVLRWLAYPLQHPGAKMESALLIYGEEGGGKNLFFSVMRRIYGEYSTIITQSELDTEFNTWASRKLLIIANEVVSRSEIRDQKGRLKNYITENVVQINEKMLPLREEANQMNFVFFSNELQPLLLDRTDRRYQVIWTPDPKPREFYAEVMREIEQGAAEAFYSVLMEMQLGDFDTHTKPMLNEAKQQLIDLSKQPAELFFDAWMGERTPLPVCTALAEDLYRGFIRWCAINGERHPPSANKFGRNMTRLKVRSKVERVRLPGDVSAKDVQRTIYIPQREDEDTGATVDEEIKMFSDALEIWLRPS